MELVLRWLEGNWFQALQATGIAAGLLFSGLSFRQNIRMNRAQTLINLTAQHRSIWMKAFDLPELRQVLDPTPLKRKKVTAQEQLFVDMIIHHVTTMLDASRRKMIRMDPGMAIDLKEFFSLPIPRKVWEDAKRFRDPRVLKYIDGLLQEKGV